MVVHLNLGKSEVELQVASVYIYGRYRKLIRGIPSDQMAVSGLQRLGLPAMRGLRQDVP